MTVRTDQLLGDTSSLPETPINPTAIPDDILLAEGFTPIFTIRHPVLQARSVFEAIAKHDDSSNEIETLFTSDWVWSHLLYDWYVHNGITPLVLDADDFMTSDTFVRDLCSKIGFNPDEAVFSWPETSREEQEGMHVMLKRVQNVLINSKGLEAGRAARNIDLEAEKAKWAEDFSGSELEMLHKLYERAVPHWEYLFARRFKGSRNGES